VGRLVISESSGEYVMEQRVYLVHALSPVHAGTGQGTGIIDLPISRDVATALPIIPGSSVKGCLRSWFSERGAAQDKIVAAFGPDTANASDHAGAACFGDAKLLCLPVRSFKGVFAWVSSPMVLNRFRTDSGLTSTDAPDVVFGAGASAIKTPDSAVTMNNLVYLEDLDVPVDTNRDADKWATVISGKVFPSTMADHAVYRQEFMKRFVIVTDDVFRFLYEHAVELNAHIRIQDESKTVQKGALWYEEALPAETILWGMVAAEGSYRYRVQKARNPGMADDDQLKDARDVLDFLFPSSLSTSLLQFGGKASTGKGRVRLI